MSNPLNMKKDYPLYDKHPDLIFAKSGKPVDDITIEKVMAGEVTDDDLRISPQTLEYQAEIQESFGNPQVAANFRRAAELCDVPDDKILEIYAALKPNGSTKQTLLDLADELENTYHAVTNATLIREAADVHERRGMLIGGANVLQA